MLIVYTYDSLKAKATRALDDGPIMLYIRSHLYGQISIRATTGAYDITRFPASRRTWYACTVHAPGEIAESYLLEVDDVPINSDVSEHSRVYIQVKSCMRHLVLVRRPGSVRKRH